MPTMTVKERIYLTWSYGKLQFLVGAVYNFMCAQLLATSFFYPILVDAFILKALVYAITIYLVKQLRDKDAVIFYINLGLSIKKLQLSIFLIDFLSLAVLMAAVVVLHG